MARLGSRGSLVSLAEFESVCFRSPDFRITRSWPPPPCIPGHPRLAWVWPIRAPVHIRICYDP